jgi:hypothetical protein
MSATFSAIMIVGALGIANMHSRLGCASTPEGADTIHAKLQIHD